MNRKAQTDIMLSAIMITFVTIIVGVVLFQVIAQTVGDSTNTHTIANESIDSLVDNLSTYYIEYRAISSAVILNGTDDAGVEIADSNYTITNNVINPTTGVLSVSITPLTTSDWTTAGEWYISGTVQPTTYVADSGSRAIAGLIAIFFALAIAVVALIPTLKSRVFETIGK